MNMFGGKSVGEALLTHLVILPATSPSQACMAPLWMPAACRGNQWIQILPLGKVMCL